MPRQLVHLKDPWAAQVSGPPIFPQTRAAAAAACCWGPQHPHLPTCLATCWGGSPGVSMRPTRWRDALHKLVLLMFCEAIVTLAAAHLCAPPAAAEGWDDCLLHQEEMQEAQARQLQCKQHFECPPGNTCA